MDEESKELMARVAKLYYEDQLTQTDIADLMGTSRSTISRLLTRARREGIVQIRILPYETRAAGLEATVKEVFGLKDAIVIKVPDRPSSEVARKHVGRFAAPFVSDLIRAGDIVGIGRGRTLHELVASMEPQEETRDVTVVQLLGDVGPLHSATRAAELSRMLAEKFRAKCYYLNAPAIVENRSTRDVLMATEAIRTVFELHKLVRIAILGIGAILDSPLLMGGLLKPEDARALAAQGIVGDICGHFFDSQGRARQTELSDRVIGMTLEDFRACELVVGVAAGPEKVEPLLGTLRGKLIHVLVSDEFTVREIVRQTIGNAS